MADSLPNWKVTLQQQDTLTCVSVTLSIHACLLLPGKGTVLLKRTGDGGAGRGSVMCVCVCFPILALTLG